MTLNDPRVCAESEDLCLFINKPVFLSCLPGTESTLDLKQHLAYALKQCLMSERLCCVFVLWPIIFKFKIYIKVFLISIIRAAQLIEIKLAF